MLRYPESLHMSWAITSFHDFESTNEYLCLYTLLDCVKQLCSSHIIIAGELMSVIVMKLYGIASMKWGNYSINVLVGVICIQWLISGNAVPWRSRNNSSWSSCKEYLGYVTDVIVDLLFSNDLSCLAQLIGSRIASICWYSEIMIHKIDERPTKSAEVEANRIID